MEAAHVLVPFLGGAVVGAIGVALGFWVRLRQPMHPARLGFHRPAPGVLVVEVRSTISAAYAEQIRTWFEAEEPETSVLVVCLEE